MAKRKGERYKCSECGLLILVEDDCGCAACELICCDVPMKKVRARPAKTATRRAKKAKPVRKKVVRNFFMPTP